MSDKLREAAQAALSAMDYMLRNGEWYCAEERANALRAALAEPTVQKSLTVAEPIGWLHWLTVDGERFPQLTLMPRTDKDEPLYTAPLAEQKPMLEMNPQKREWVGLTDDEVMILNRKSYDAQIGLLPLTFYRAIEAKLREKNGG